MKKLLIYAIGIFAFLPACKKNDNDAISSKIIGKWTIVEQRLITSVNGIETERETRPYAPGSYSDYSSNGNVYYRVVDATSGYVRLDTNQYKIQGNVLLTGKYGNWSAMDIATLTSHNLMLRLQDTLFHDNDTTWTLTNEVDLTK